MAIFLNYIRASIRKIKLMKKLHRMFFECAKNGEYKTALNIKLRIDRVSKI